MCKLTCTLKPNIHYYVFHNLYLLKSVYMYLLLSSCALKQNKRRQIVSGFHHCTSVAYSSVPHLFRGEILVRSGEKLCHEGLYGPHHGAETIDAEQHSGAHPTSTAGHVMVCPARPVATLPVPAKTHRSSPGPLGRLTPSDESAV